MLYITSLKTLRCLAVLLNFEFLNQGLHHSRCSTKFPNQKLRQIGPGVHKLWNPNRQLQGLLHSVYIMKYIHLEHSCIPTAWDKRALLESSQHYLQWTLRCLHIRSEGRPNGSEPLAQLASLLLNYSSHGTGY